MEEALNNEFEYPERIHSLFQRVLSEALVDARYFLDHGPWLPETAPLEEMRDDDKATYLHGLYIVAELMTIILRGLESPRAEVFNQAFETMRASSKDIHPRKEDQAMPNNQRQTRRAKRRNATMGKCTNVADSPE